VLVAGVVVWEILGGKTVARSICFVVQAHGVVVVEGSMSFVYNVPVYSGSLVVLSRLPALSSGSMLSLWCHGGLVKVVRNTWIGVLYFENSLIQ
jgi:hypothetical protein